MAKVYEIYKRLGEAILHFESMVVCFESGRLTNKSGAGITGMDLLIYPVKAGAGGDYDLALEADSAAGIVGFVAEQGLFTIADQEVLDRKVRILVRGPAAVNKVKFPVNDAAGTPFTQANLIAAAEAMGIVVRDEVGPTSIQEL